MQLRPLSLLRGALLALTLAGAAACGKSDGPSGNDEPESRLDITNDSNLYVWYVQVRACGSQAWGQDLLGADIIAPNSGQSFIVAPGCYDVKLTAEPETNSQKIWTNVDFPEDGIAYQTVTTWDPVE